MNKTKASKKSVAEFLNGIENKQRKKDALEVLQLMKEITGEQPVLWGASLIGFGSYHYKYESGHEGDYFLTGFSPRKTALTLYIMAGFSRYEQLMGKLGKYKTGKSCLYLKSLDDVDLTVLTELIKKSLNYMKKNYG